MSKLTIDEGKDAPHFSRERRRMKRGNAGAVGGQAGQIGLRDEKGVCLNVDNFISFRVN